ncbi:MAG: hypothetical protein E6H47_06015 [Betaproteobacteria bacterium]|nr:MAG: hypothetical protein E6H47_06015 [Betaproteobacteria bacterium]
MLAAGSTVSSFLPGFLDPGRQDLLAAALRVVVEIVQLLCCTKSGPPVPEPVVEAKDMSVIA